MGLLIRPQAGGFLGTLETWVGMKCRSLTFNVGGGRALGADSSGGPPCRWGESVCPPGDMSSHLKTLLITALSGWVLLWHLRGKVQEYGYTSFDARESTLTAPPAQSVIQPPTAVAPSGRDLALVRAHLRLARSAGPVRVRLPGVGSSLLPSCLILSLDSRASQEILLSSKGGGPLSCLGYLDGSLDKHDSSGQVFICS